MLGNFNTNSFNLTKSPAVTTLVFIGFMLIVVVVCLNAVIALLGDSYSSVMERSEAERSKQTAFLIVEQYDVMNDVQREELELSTAWAHTLVPWTTWKAQAAALEAPDVAAEAPTAEVAAIRAEVQASQRVLEAKVDALALSLARIEAALSPVGAPGARVNANGHAPLSDEAALVLDHDDGSSL